jgi:predicted nucleic acid-binding protein
MGLVDVLKNKTVFLDTAPLIYFIEGHSPYQLQLKEIFDANDSQEFQFVTSTLTLLEVLVQPLRFHRFDLVDQYETILRKSSAFHIWELSLEIARRAAELRAEYSLRTPDAIQLATALSSDSSVFFTNDMRLKQVKEIEVITLSEV